MHLHTRGSLVHHSPHCPHYTNTCCHNHMIVHVHVQVITIHCTHVNDSLLCSSGLGATDESVIDGPEGGAVAAAWLLCT
jgi:hypothetical protein